MKILGINTSHDASVCLVEDGEVKAVYEEDRCRRQKWYCPLDRGQDFHEVGYMAIDQFQLHECDKVAYASYDRRGVTFEFTDNVHNDRVLQKDLIDFISAKQMNRERIAEMQKEFGPTVVKGVDYADEQDGTTSDEVLNESIHEQIHCEDRTPYFKHEHHYFHAVCGSHLSPYDESLVITWDGGGFQNMWDTHPGYQEIEAIWHHKGDSVEPLWKKFTNTRMLDDIQQQNFRGWMEDSVYCLEDEEFTKDGVEYVMSSLPSMGMNFSNMSVALGADDLGRGAGKIMGMASYSSMIPRVHSRHNAAQAVERDSYDNAVEVIQKAISLRPDVKNIVLSGGFSLNCTNNYKYLKAFPDHQFFVDPIPHDGGTAVGAALDLWRNK
tara:strand:- start:3709 stop:4851 length:1143 start_codon:yes stop_codon:yes gene_type:complete